MDNNQNFGVPGMPMHGAQGMPVQGAPMMNSPMQPGGPQYVNGQPIQQMGPNGMPMVQQIQAPVEPQKDVSGLVKTIVIIIVSLIAVTFIGLFIWMMLERNEAQTDVDSKIAVAVAEAKDEQAMELENEFLEREKYPFKTFSGPADYGQLTFEYPKTWSVYVAEAATTGGDFNAYFNPGQVDAVANDTINALRVTIYNTSIDEVTERYQWLLESEEAGMTMTSVTIGKNNNIVANRYTGTIPDTKLSVIFVTFKIRDKTAVLQTDSLTFKDDFDKLLGTVVFNE